MKTSKQVVDSSQRLRSADAEAVRAFYWAHAPLAARFVVVMAANLPQERARDSLSTFDAVERNLIWYALEKLVAQLSVIQKCMDGGRIPSKTAAVH